MNFKRVISNFTNENRAVNDSAQMEHSPMIGGLDPRGLQLHIGDQRTQIMIYIIIAYAKQFAIFTRYTIPKFLEHN